MRVWKTERAETSPRAVVPHVHHVTLCIPTRRSKLYDFTFEEVDPVNRLVNFVDESL